ncbi:hypothetical protein [Rhodoferax sp.]|uniref:hypothetical protein n=1 Tax=Rhodoferax sp. TaxID=50421 RepID=UPI00374DA23D
MNINDFVKAQSVARYLGSQGMDTSLQTGTQAASFSLAGQAGFQKAEKRIQAQVDSASAQLSSFGKLQSSLFAAQSAAGALTSLANNSTAAAQKSAAVDFAAAFNAAVAAAKATAALTGDSAATRSASRTGQDLLQALGGNTATTSALKKLGFSLASGGNLQLDSKTFDAAVKANGTAVLASLATLGQNVYTAAAKELGFDGNVGLSLSSLGQRASILKTQQAMLASLGLSTNTTTSGSNSGAYDFGLAAYRKSLDPAK